MTKGSELAEKFNSWTKEHRAKAQSEGWDLFNYDGRGLLQIQRIDELEVFESDGAAVDFVSKKADEGDKTAQLALELDHFFEPFIYGGVKIEEDIQSRNENKGTQTKKKKAVAVIEFDDEQSNFLDATDFATYIQGLLEKDFTDCAVTVYSTPDDLNADVQDGIGPYAEKNALESVALPNDADEESLAPKM